MEKKFGKLMALILALVLVFPLLARPALANQNAALAEEPSVVKVYLYDSNGEQKALMNAFLVSDPASELTFLVGSSRIAETAEQNYSIRLVRSNGSELKLQAVAYSDRFTYLYVPDLLGDSKLVLSTQAIGQAAQLRAIYWTTRNGEGQVYKADFSLDKGWGKVSGSDSSEDRWVWSNHPVEDPCMLSAPVVRTSDGAVVGLVEEQKEEMVIVPLEPGVMPVSCSLEKWGQTAKDSGRDTDGGEQAKPQVWQEPAAESGSFLRDNLTWIIVGAAALVVILLALRSRKKPAVKEETPLRHPTAGQPCDGEGPGLQLRHLSERRAAGSQPGI